MKLLLVFLLTVSASTLPSIDPAITQAQVLQSAAPATPPSEQSSGMLKTFHSIYQDAVKTAITEIDKRLGQKPKEQVVYVHINPAFVPKLDGLDITGPKMVLVAKQNVHVPQALYAQPLGIQPPAQQHHYARPLILQGHYAQPPAFQQPAQQISTLPIILNDLTHHQNVPILQTRQPIPLVHSVDAVRLLQPL